MKQFKPMQLWNVLYPVFLYYAVTILILSVVDFFLPRPMDFALLRQLITSVAVFPFLYKWYRAELFFEKKDVRIPFIAVAFLTGGCFAVALNNLLGMVRIEDYSASYGQVEQTFYTGRLLIEIVALCVVIPLVEEFLYRGMVYGSAYEPGAVCVRSGFWRAFGLFSGTGGKHMVCRGCTYGGEFYVCTTGGNRGVFIFGAGDGGTGCGNVIDVWCGCGRRVLDKMPKIMNYCGHISISAKME